MGSKCYLPFGIWMAGRMVLILKKRESCQESLVWIGHGVGLRFWWDKDNEEGFLSLVRSGQYGTGTLVGRTGAVLLYWPLGKRMGRAVLGHWLWGRRSFWK